MGQGIRNIEEGRVREREGGRERGREGGRERERETVRDTGDTQLSYPSVKRISSRVSIMPPGTTYTDREGWGKVEQGIRNIVGGVLGCRGFWGC